MTRGKVRNIHAQSKHETWTGSSGSHPEFHGVSIDGRRLAMPSGKFHPAAQQNESFCALCSDSPSAIIIV